MTLPRDQCAPYKLIQEYLKEDRLSVHELSEKLGISRRNTQQYLVLLRERGIIRIAEYSRIGRKGGCSTPLYTLGKWNAPRPRPLTNNECAARHRHKHRATINAEKRTIREKESGKEVPIFTKMLKSMGML